MKAFILKNFLYLEMAQSCRFDYSSFLAKNK